MLYKVTNIQYDTNGEDVNLPQELTINIPNSIHPEEIDEFIGDAISDKTGFCHKGFSMEPVNEDKKKTQPYKVEPLSALRIRMTVDDIKWLTEQTGYDWLYDYQYKTGRVLAFTDLLDFGLSESNPELEEYVNHLWENICETIEKPIMDTYIMFVPYEGEESHYNRI